MDNITKIKMDAFKWVCPECFTELKSVHNGQLQSNIASHMVKHQLEKEREKGNGD